MALSIDSVAIQWRNNFYVRCFIAIAVIFYVLNISAGLMCNKKSECKHGNEGFFLRC